jgi:hypothetical protein
MAAKYWNLIMQSNNTDQRVIERLEAENLTDAINAAKTTLAAVKAIAGMPQDMRIKELSFLADVEVPPAPP